MLTDYKIVSETDDNGIIRQKVRFYEGDETTEIEHNFLTHQDEPVTRYRRSNMYEEVTYEYDATN